MILEEIVTLAILWRLKMQKKGNSHGSSSFKLHDFVQVNLSEPQYRIAIT